MSAELRSSFVSGQEYAYVGLDEVPTLGRNVSSDSNSSVTGRSDSSQGETKFGDYEIPPDSDQTQKSTAASNKTSAGGTVNR